MHEEIEQWNGKERRQEPRREHDSLTKQEFEKRLAIFRHSTTEQINTRFIVLEEKIISKLSEIDKTLKSGFPNGDPVEHRRDHETEIKMKLAKEELFKSVREKVITSGVWGIILLICFAVWEYIKQSVVK